MTTAPDDERNQALRRPAEHEHVVRARREQVVDLAEHAPRRRANLEPLEVRPIILAGCASRQSLALDDDVGAHPFARPIAIVHAAQLRDHAAAVACPSSTSNRLSTPRSCAASTRRTRAMLSRGSVYDCTLSHPFTPNTPLTRPRVTHFVGFALTAESQGAPHRYAAGRRSPGTALSRSVTRSDGCAPCATQ